MTALLEAVMIGSMMRTLLTLICFMMIMPIGSITYAQNIKKLVVPCALPYYRELDFIVGDWQVYYKSSGKLAGYDRIGRTLKGCAIQQSWISLDDYFSSHYVPFRMNGKSLTAFNGTNWVQMWVDNQAGVQILKGGSEKGQFILRSEESVGGFDYELIWKIQKNGNLLNTHQRRSVNGTKKGEWKILYEWVYVKNLNEFLIPEEEENE